MSGCVIVGAGPSELGNVKSDDFIIAADAGYAKVLSAGLRPCLVIGDFDSLGYVPDEPDVIVLPSQKDETDTFAAMQAALERGFIEIHVMGGVGGRLDHTLANIQTMAYAKDQGAQVFLHGSRDILTMLSGQSMSFETGGTGTVSIFSHTDRACGVTLSGMRYPLVDATLTGSYPLGVSNELTGQAARITVKTGKLLVVFPSDAPPPTIRSLDGA